MTIDQEVELWSTIPEFPNYQVSSYGHIRNAQTGALLKVSHTQHGHAKIALYSREDHCRQTRSVAQLVAEAFVEVPRSAPEIVFDYVVLLDGDLYNVAAYNLVWRPARFAWLYTRQLKTPQPANYGNLPVINKTTGVVYDSIFDASVSEGLLFADVWKSTYSGERVFPNGHIFEIYR